MPRKFLIGLTAAVVIAGFGVVFWALVQSLGPPAHRPPAAPVSLTVKMSDIPPDSEKRLVWHGRTVLIFRPGPIADNELPALNGHVAPPVLSPGRLPPAFVYFPQSTFRGCGLVLDKNSDLPGRPPVWRDPCHVGRWDRAGRFILGSGPAGLRNLDIPRYRFSGDWNNIELL